MPIISVFNNKGGVGKTTYMYHIAHVLAKKGKRILLVDLDSQCNLSAYCLSFSKLESEWNIDGSSICQFQPVWVLVKNVTLYNLVNIRKIFFWFQEILHSVILKIN